MASRKRNATQVSYYRERRRLQNQMSRMRSRGYLFNSSDIIPAIPKKITLASVRRLQKITTKSLYKKAEYFTEGMDEIVTGVQGRQLERSKSAQKAAQTRKNRAWERTRQNLDSRNKEKISSDPDFTAQFQKGLMMKERINELINERATANPAMAERLRSLLADAEAEEGNALWNRLADNPDVIETLETTFYESSYLSVIAYNSFEQIVFNRALTAQEIKDTNDTYETDLPFESPD